MAKITKERLDFYVKNNLNVLLRGEKGCGKSTMVIDCFQRNNLKYRIFSAATMDPWVDFIGVPKEKRDPVTGKDFLDLVRPKEFAEDDVEAIFLDEFNRSRPRVRNAVLELIQFKSINGKKFNNLKVVWAAINPEDEAHTYDVETLDPAQVDRFHVILDVPYTPDLDYFKKKFGADVAKSSLEWWQELSPDQKKLVSPRRLDYALEVFNMQGDMRDVLGSKVNVSGLVNVLETGSSLTKLKTYVKNKDVEGARLHLRNENNYNTALPYILKDKKMLSFFVPIMDEEKIMSLLQSNATVKDMVFNQDPKSYIKVLEPIYRQDDTEISALAKKAVIEKCPELQRPDYAPGVPLIASTNIKTILNPSKTTDDLVKELVKYVPGQKVQPADPYFKTYNADLVQLPTSVEVKMLYDTLLGYSPLIQTNDSARALVDLATIVAEKATPAQIAKDLVELNGLFNWGMLHLHVFALPHPDPTRVEAAYQKSILKPEDRAFVFRS